jgi:glycosyltransferase involved in cell wall biosynthesis
MRILQVIHSLRRGGAERVVVDLSIGLVNRGHDVGICLVSPANNFVNELKESVDKPIHFYTLLNNVNSHFLPHYPTIVLKLKKFVKEFNADIVHCHLRTDGAICFWLNEVPVVRTMHSSTPIKRYRDFPLTFAPINWFEKRSLLADNHKIVACSQASADSLYPYLKKRFSQPRLTVIENGTALSRIKRSTVYDHTVQPRSIVVTGTLDKTYKNQQMAILGIRELLKKNVHYQLWLLGDGPERANLELLTRKLNLENHVIFFGEVDNVQEYLSKASLCWVTSRYEGLPIALLETMAAGLPVVATAALGVEEVLKPWPELLVKVDDYMALADVTAKLMDNPERMKAIGDALREYAFKRFNADRMVEDYISFYQSCF